MPASFCPQVCSAGSRILIQETIYDKFVTKLKERMSHLRVGDSLDKAIDMGAVVDQSQLKTVEELVESARQEGAEVVHLKLLVFSSYRNSNVLVQILLRVCLVVIG